MKEKLEISLTTLNNRSKGPNFAIFHNDRQLDRQENFFDSTYTGVFNIETSQGTNKIIIEHYGKNPKDTILEDGETKADVAISLVSMKFNNVACHPVDLHENYFYPRWKYDVGDKIKNNLYFGYNGTYEYLFDSPVSEYLLAQHDKYKKEDFFIEQDKYVSEDEFVSCLKKHIDDEQEYLL